MRVDSGVYQGAIVPVHYDPMVAKLVTWGADREEAIARLGRALSEFVVKGIKTSIPFHQRVFRHPKFLEGHYDTGFIDEHLGGSIEAAEDPEAERVAYTMAAIAAYRAEKSKATRAASATQGGGGPGSQWRQAGRRQQMRGGPR